MASRTEAAPKPATSIPTGTVVTKTAPTTSTTNTTGGGSSNAWENTTQQNMTPEALAQLNNLIKTLEGGGTPEQRASEARRRQTQAMVEQLLGTVSTGQAMTDAEGMMALNLQQAMEKNMPAISKAIEGAGTSASSMQAVLSQQAARDAALASASLGGQLAGQYASNRSSLAGTLEALTRPTNDVTKSLIDAMSVAKGAVTNSQRSGGGSSSTFSSSVTNTPETTKIETSAPLLDFSVSADPISQLAAAISGTSTTSQGLPAYSGWSTGGAADGTQLASGVYKNSKGVYSDRPN